MATALFTLLLSMSALAEITIVDIFPSESQDCLGGFTVRANGTAGPFTVIVTEIIGAGGFSLAREILKDTTDGEVVLKELCNGNFSVTVFPTRFPGCVTHLEAVLEGDKKELEPDLAKTVDFPMEVSPNPTSGEVMITVTDQRLVESTAKSEWTITATNANGVPIQESKVLGKVAHRRHAFPFDLGNQPRGVYFVTVTHPNGVKETSRVVVQ